MNLQIKPQTKREMIIFLTVAIGFTMLTVLIANDYQKKEIEELKQEKQKLEIEKDELWEEYKNEIKTNIKTKTGSVRDSIPDTYHSGVELNRIEREDDVSAVIENQIRVVAEEMNFKWTDYLIRLAKCESSLNTNAKNVNKSGSVDRGVFQINDYWHKEVSDEQAYDLKFATEWTIKAINEGHQNWWTCDKIIKKNSLTALSK